MRRDKFLGLRSASREGSDGPVGAQKDREELMAAIGTGSSYRKCSRRPARQRSSACPAGAAAAAAPCTCPASRTVLRHPCVPSLDTD